MAYILIAIKGLLCLTQAGVEPLPFPAHSPWTRKGSLPWNQPPCCSAAPFQAEQHFYSLKTQSGHNLVRSLGIMTYFSLVSVYSVPELNLVKASRKVLPIAINEFVSHALKPLQVQPITTKAR